MQAWTELHPVLAIGIGLLALAWLVLLFLVPFMIEGIRAWTVRNHQELRAINARLEELNALLAGSMAEQESRGSARMTARREPTLSDYEIDVDD
jgi:hypothetical protein